MTETTREHVRQPLRMLGRQVQPRRCSCGELWPCAAVRAIDEAPAGGQPESRSPADPAASALAEAKRIADGLHFACRIPGKVPDFTACGGPAAEAYWAYFTPARIVGLVAAVEAALKLTEPGSEVHRDLDGNEERGVVRVVRCDVLREAITAELAGKEAGHE